MTKKSKGNILRESASADCDLVLGIKLNAKKETIRLILIKNRFSDDFPVKELTMKLKTDKTDKKG